MLLQSLPPSDTDSNSGPSNTDREACFPEALNDLIYLLFQRGTLDVKDLSQLACVANSMRKFIASFLRFDAVLCYRMDLLREPLEAFSKQRNKLEALFEKDHKIQGERKDFVKECLDELKTVLDEVAREMEIAGGESRVTGTSVRKLIINIAEDQASAQLAPANEGMFRDRSTVSMVTSMQVESKINELSSRIERSVTKLEGCYQVWIGDQN